MNRVTLVLAGTAALFLASGTSLTVAADANALKLPCIGKGNGGHCQIGIYPCETLISVSEKSVKDRIQWKVDGWYQGKERHPMGRDKPVETSAVLPICSVVATEFNQGVTEESSNHKGSSCGKKVDINVDSTFDVSLNRRGDDGRWEDGQLRGAKVSAYACSVAQVVNEARRGSLGLSPECADLGRKIELFTGRIRLLSDQLRGTIPEMACLTLNQGKFEVCTEKGSTVNGAPIQSACQVAAAGVDLQVAMNELLTCETFARGDRGYDLAFNSAAGRSRLDAKVRKEVADGCESKARDECTLPGCHEDVAQKCYDQKIAPKFREIIEYHFPSSGDCKLSSAGDGAARGTVNASSGSLLILALGFAGLRRRRAGQALAGAVVAAFAFGCASASVSEPKCMDYNGTALIDDDMSYSFPDKLAQVCCGIKNWSASTFDCAHKVPGENRSCYVLTNEEMTPECPWHVPADVASSGGFAGSTGIVGGDFVKAGNTAIDTATELLSESQTIAVGPAQPNAFAASAGGARRESDDPNGSRRASDRSRDPAGGDSSRAGNGGGGGAPGTGSSGASGGSVGGVSTEPSGVSAQGDSAITAAGAGDTAYSGGGGGAQAGSSNGSPFGDLFGGGGSNAPVAGAATLGFGPGDLGAMRASGSADPEDYFTRLGVDESLFKVVEKKYKQAETKGSIGL